MSPGSLGLTAVDDELELDSLDSELSLLAELEALDPLESLDPLDELDGIELSLLAELELLGNVPQAANSNPAVWLSLSSTATTLKSYVLLASNPVTVNVVAGGGNVPPPEFDPDKIQNASPVIL